MTNFEKLKAEVERLKEQVKVMRERQSLISQSRKLVQSERKIKGELRQEKKRLKRELHPERAKFSDFVARQFAKAKAKGKKKITFKEAVRLAKKAYYGDL